MILNSLTWGCNVTGWCYIVLDVEQNLNLPITPTLKLHQLLKIPGSGQTYCVARYTISGQDSFMNSCCIQDTVGLIGAKSWV